MNIVLKAIKKAGTQAKLSEKLSEKGHFIKQPSISAWVKNGKISSRYAVAVEEITGISRTELCPGFNWGTGGNSENDN